VSRHWNPDGERARCTGADGLARPGKAPLPQGSVAGMVLVAVCCLALGLALYQFAGPRDVVEESVARR
jgi:hypothetical protein